MTPKTPYERVPNDTATSRPPTRTVATPDKENAIFLARQNVALRDDDATSPRSTWPTTILGGGAGFDSRLNGAHPPKDGLSYGVVSDSFGGLDRPRGLVVGVRDRRARQRARVETAFGEESRAR